MHGLTPDACARTVRLAASGAPLIFTAVTSLRLCTRTLQVGNGVREAPAAAHLERAARLTPLRRRRIWRRTRRFMRDSCVHSHRVPQHRALITVRVHVRTLFRLFAASFSTSFSRARSTRIWSTKAVSVQPPNVERAGDGRGPDLLLVSRQALLQSRHVALLGATHGLDRPVGGCRSALGDLQRRGARAEWRTACRAEAHLLSNPLRHGEGGLLELLGHALGHLGRSTGRSGLHNALRTGAKASSSHHT